MSSERLKKLSMVPLLWLVSFIAYRNSFDVPFQFDDFDFVRNNEAIRHLDHLATIWNFHSTRFLTFVSFAWNYRLNGIDVFGFHVVNFIIHLVTVATVYVFALLFFGRDEKDSRANIGAAAVVALFFACHPLQTEAVTYVSQRPASQMACFYLLAMTFYLKAAICRETGERFRSRVWFLASLPFALMAMYSKQSAITLPVAIVLLEFSRFGMARANWKGKLFRIIPFFVIASLVPITALLFSDVERYDGLLQSQLLPSYWVHAWIEIAVLKKYLALLVWPVGQNLDHDILLNKNILDPEVWFSLFLHSALMVWAVRARKKNAGIFFGVLFFYLAISVESFVAILPDRMVEHRLYLPSLGMFLAFAGQTRATVTEWTAGLRTKNQELAAWLGLALLAIPLTVLTRERNEIWRNDESLWTDTVRKSPGKPRPLVNLSRIYYRQGRCKNALEALHVAVVNAPKYYSAHSLFGLCLVQLGLFDRAIAELDTALSLSEELHTTFNAVREESYYGLGQAYEGKGDGKTALKYYEECVKAGPVYAGLAYEGIGRLSRNLLHELNRDPAAKK